MTLERNKSFPLRLPRTMRQQVEKLAEDEGISINQFISLALAERITRLEQFFQSSEPVPSPTTREDQ
jgi:hypothetical protein